MSDTSSEFQWTLPSCLYKQSHVNISQVRWCGFFRPNRATLFVCCLDRTIEVSREHHHKAHCLVEQLQLKSNSWGQIEKLWAASIVPKESREMRNYSQHKRLGYIFCVCWPVVIPLNNISVCVTWIHTLQCLMEDVCALFAVVRYYP